MGWRSDREDYLERFERRSFGVLTRDEAMALAILSEELGPDYETTSVKEWDAVRNQARDPAREALARLAPVVDETNRSTRELLEERDALRTRLAIVEALLAREVPNEER